MRWLFLILLISCTDNTEEDMRLFIAMAQSNNALVIVDSNASRIKMPDITSAIYNAVGTGFTCTGLAFDEVATNLRTDGKYVFWIGSDGRSDEDNTGTETFQGALVQVALDREEASNDYISMPTLELLDEINLTTLVGHLANASVQGVAIDKRGYLWATQFNDLLCIDPSTKLLVGKTTHANGWQGLAYDWDNDKMYITDRVNVSPKIVSLWDINGVTGTVTLNNSNIMTVPDSIDIISMTKDDNLHIWGSLGSTGRQYNLSGVEQQSVSVGGTNIQSEGLTVVNGYFFIISDAYYHHLNTPPDESLGDVNAIHKIKL